MNRKNTHGWKLQTNYQVISKFVGHFSVSNFTGNLCFKGLSKLIKSTEKVHDYMFGAKTVLYKQN